ncbi:MAG: hypothetical protein AAGA16_15085, partial [Cyanobacteria bacterium P01_E01_bin.35]
QDSFVLGDRVERFYDLAQNNDFARITDYGGSDTVQLKGSRFDYVVGFTNEKEGSVGAGLYYDADNNGRLTPADDLLAVFEGVTENTLNQDKNSSNFIYL